MNAAKHSKEILMDQNNAMPRPQGHRVEINKRALYIPEWNMQKQIKNAKYVMPLVAEPLANAAAMAGEDDSEGMYTAAVIHGVVRALGDNDLSTTIPILLDGVLVENDHGVPQMATLKNLEETYGMNFAHVLKICAEVIKVNVGPLFEDGLQGMLTGM
jgi:hypothetical protein